MIIISKEDFEVIKLADIEKYNNTIISKFNYLKNVVDPLYLEFETIYDDGYQQFYDTSYVEYQNYKLEKNNAEKLYNDKLSLYQVIE